MAFLCIATAAFSTRDYSCYPTKKMGHEQQRQQQQQQQQRQRQQRQITGSWLGGKSFSESALQKIYIFGIFWWFLHAAKDEVSTHCHLGVSVLSNHLVICWVTDGHCTDFRLALHDIRM